MKMKSKAFWFISILVLLPGCGDKGIEPVAILSVNSHYGYPNRVLTFSSANSTDADNDKLGLKSRWDFESDGIWDTPFSLAQKINRSYPDPGLFVVTLEVTDPAGLTSRDVDTIRIFGPLKDSLIVDPRDLQSYRIVNINSIWIMAENLRFGQRIQSDQQQTNNSQVEYYAYDNDPNYVINHGGLYTWWEAMDYKWATSNQGICPPGWRIPDQKDLKEFDLQAPHFFISDYYGVGGLSGFNIDFSGFYYEQPFSYLHNSYGSYFSSLGIVAYYWCSNYEINEIVGYAYYGKFSISSVSYWLAHRGIGINKTPFTYVKFDDGFYRIMSSSVRCVSDKLNIPIE